LEQPRIGVFICHCGKNIAGIVDVKKVAQEVAKLPGVVYVEDYVYMCSDPGQQKIIEAIKKENLNAVVVAACTPSLHYETFAKAVEAGGLSRYKYEMACIREHSSWVHFDKKKATEKAIRIVAAAVAKVSKNKVYKPITGKVVPKALIIGGGIAGMTASTAAPPVKIV